MGHGVTPMGRRLGQGRRGQGRLGYATRAAGSGCGVEARVGARPARWGAAIGNGPAGSVEGDIVGGSSGHAGIAAIGRWIDGFHDPIRRRSTLDTISPITFQQTAA